MSEECWHGVEDFRNCVECGDSQLPSHKNNSQQNILEDTSKSPTPGNKTMKSNSEDISADTRKGGEIIVDEIDKALRGEK